MSRSFLSLPWPTTRSRQLNRRGVCSLFRLPCIDPNQPVAFRRQSPMLRSLNLTNFRAFRSLRIDFSKLNIFVGPNNSGKSSIISAINLVAQNARQGRASRGLALNGAYVDLGTYYDAVYGHKANSNMRISFEIEKFSYEYHFRYRIQRREIQLYKAVITDGANRYNYNLGKEGASHSVYLRAVDAVYNLGRFRPRVFGLNLYVPYVAVADIERDNPDTEIQTSLRRLLVRGTSGLETGFMSFDSVGSFRAPPQRTYLYSGEAPEEVGRAGENFAQIIAASSSSRDRAAQAMVRRVGEWFRGAGVANGIQIRGLTNRHFELCIEDRLGFSSNIVDAGFGCSQVLPVIIGGYKLLDRSIRPSQPIYVVQEPEIHLHPSAAAHLGTFFCELSKSNIQCFVETHSENLILRVARHIANGHIDPDHVRIFWVSENEGEHSVTPLEFRDDGSFSIDWPDGFFPTRSFETLELARAAAHLPQAAQLELSLDD